jgi:uncharacterized protein YuzE
MNATYDPKADAAYLYLSKEKIAKSRVISDSMNFDLDADGKLVGIEFLDAKSQLAGSTLQSFSQI